MPRWGAGGTSRVEAFETFPDSIGPGLGDWASEGAAANRRARGRGPKSRESCWRTGPARRILQLADEEWRAAIPSSSRRAGPVQHPPAGPAPVSSPEVRARRVGMVTFRPPDSDAGNTQTDRGKLRVRPHSRTPVRRPARRAEAFTGLIESGCDCRPQRTSAIGAGSAQPYYALRTDLARSRWRLRTTAQMQSLPSLNLTPDRPLDIEVYDLTRGPVKTARR